MAQAPCEHALRKNGRLAIDGCNMMIYKEKIFFSEKKQLGARAAEQDNGIGAKDFENNSNNRNRR
jgi:hypothetical protein